MHLDPSREGSAPNMLRGLLTVVANENLYSVAVGVGFSLILAVQDILMLLPAERACPP